MTLVVPLILQEWTKPLLFRQVGDNLIKEQLPETLGKMTLQFTKSA